MSSDWAGRNNFRGGRTALIRMARKARYRSRSPRRYCLPKPSARMTVELIVQTTSAIVVSILWKYTSPAQKITTTIPTDASNKPPGGLAWPVSAHRNPSITPVIGFKPKSHRHHYDTRLLG